MSQEPASDEIFCRSCGEPIKKKAAICPECGVENQYDSDAGQNASQATTATDHDPSQYTAAVSEFWHYAVGAAVAMWVLAFVLPDVFDITGWLAIIGWILMPVGIYYDTKWIRANTEWNPSSDWWLIGSLIPLINIVTGVLYLVRQHNVSSNFTVDEADEESGDALSRLKQRYSEGEISEQEFEQRLETLLETEDRDEARQIIEQTRKER